MSQEDLRERSGSINIKSRLVSFLYDLMRDHLTPGQVEELVTEATDTGVAYTNGYLAQYAWDLAQRLQPNPFSQGGLVKEVLRTRFMLVKEGHSTPAEEADKVYAAITAQDSVFSTGKSQSKNEIVDPPRVKEFEKGFSQQSILKAEDERVMAALKEADQEGATRTEATQASNQKAAPPGLYGVFCEPLGHMGDPKWSRSRKPMSYEEAAKEADFMNRSNHSWYYYAKPIR